MFRKAMMVFVGLALLILGTGTDVLAKKKRSATFKVVIENVASANGLMANDGSTYPFALSPGLFVLTTNDSDFFKAGKNASEGLERQAEDGNPDVLAKNLLTKIGSINMGVFNTPVGAAKPAPILPGGSFEFTFTADEGMKLNLIAMYGQSNDLFYAPAKAIDLFTNGEGISGDITDRFLLWDAGTEVNEAPGIGPEQAPRQKSANSGTTEKLKIGAVKDAFSYPNTKDVLKVTITRQ